MKEFTINREATNKFNLPGVNVIQEYFSESGFLCADCILDDDCKLPSGLLDYLENNRDQVKSIILKKLQAK